MSFFLPTFAYRNKQHNNQTTKTTTSMKKQKLYGRRANWDALEVSAINTKTFTKEHTSDFPEGMRIVAFFIDNYNYRARVLNDAPISVEDATLVLENATSADFTLIKDGLIVGYAYYRKRHRRHPKRYRATATVTATLTFPVEVSALSHKEANAFLAEAREIVEATLPEGYELSLSHAHRVRE